ISSASGSGKRTWTGASAVVIDQQEEKGQVHLSLHDSNRGNLKSFFKWTCPLYFSVAQPVAGVAVGVLLKVVLVVVFGAPVSARLRDFGDDRLLPLARFVDLGLHALGNLALA